MKLDLVPKIAEVKFWMNRRVQKQVNEKQFIFICASLELCERNGGKFMTEKIFFILNITLILFIDWYSRRVL